MVPWHVLEVLDCLIGLGKYCQGVTGKEDEYGRVSSPCRGVWVGMSLAGRSHLLPMWHLSLCLGRHCSPHFAFLRGRDQVALNCCRCHSALVVSYTCPPTPSLFLCKCPLGHPWVPSISYQDSTIRGC